MNRYDNLVNLTPNLWSNDYFEYRISLIVKMTAAVAIGKNSVFKVKLFMLCKKAHLWQVVKGLIECRVVDL